MARGEVYLPLSVDFADNPKVIAAGERAEVLYVRAALLSKRTLSDGYVADVQLARLGLSGVKARAAALVREGLWERVDGGYQILGFLDRNPSRAKVLADRRADAERKKNGRDAARNPNGVQPDKPRTSERNPPGVREPETETETSTTSRLLADSRPAPDPSDDEDQDQQPPDQGNLNQLVDRALALLVDRDLDARQQNALLAPIGDPEAWKRKATRQRVDRGTPAALIELARLDPQAGPEQLADALEPPRNGTPPAEPQRPAIPIHVAPLGTDPERSWTGPPADLTDRWAHLPRRQPGAAS